MTNKTSGFLRMLEHKNLNPVDYSLIVVSYKNTKKIDPTEVIIDKISLNELIGKKLRLSFSGVIRCVDCGKITKKSFGGGSCFKCFQSLASNDFCILKPSGCHFHLGTCREKEWGLNNCFKPHKLYLANSTGIKVGITKENPIHKRWVDQGAIMGLPLIEVESRLNSGILEDEFSKFITDKSQWQKLISEDSAQIDLKKESIDLLQKVDLNRFDFSIKILKEESTKIQYPILSYPKKKKSLKPDPNSPLEGELLGIKGQYLLFEEGGMNIRSLSGYEVDISL